MRYETLAAEKNDMEMEYEDRIKNMDERHAAATQQVAFVGCCSMLQCVAVCCSVLCVCHATGCYCGVLGVGVGAGVGESIAHGRAEMLNTRWDIDVYEYIDVYQYIDMYEYIDMYQYIDK